MNKSGPELCLCCGAKDGRFAPLCQCARIEQCVLCLKCSDHHHPHCTLEIREKAEQIMAAARRDIATLWAQHITRNWPREKLHAEKREH